MRVRSRRCAARPGRSPSCCGPCRLAPMVLVGALLGATLLAGCGRDEAPSDPAAPTTTVEMPTTTSTSATASASTTTAAPTNATVPPPTSSPLLDTMAPLKLEDGRWNSYQREIFEAYVRAEQAAIKAQMDPVNPDDAELAQTHTGAILAIRQDAIRTMRDRGEALQAPTIFEIRPYRFIRADETRALFYACFTSNQPLYDVRTSAILGDATFSKLLEVGTEAVRGRWQLAVRTHRKEAEGKTCEQALPPA